MPPKVPLTFTPIWINPGTKEVIGPPDFTHECPKCGHPTPFPLYKEKFCPQCGLMQEPKRVTPPPDSIICQRCHTRNSRDNKFCTDCGTFLE